MKTQTHERENPTCGTIAKYIVIAFLIIYGAYLGGQVVHYVENVDYYIEVKDECIY